MSRTLENKTRMTIDGYRCRVGNPKHPFYDLYKSKGFAAVYEAMGLIENKAIEIKKEVMALYGKHIGGHVYVITNPAWEGWVKIGMAVDAVDRCNSYNTSSPHRDYKLVYAIKTNNRYKTEKKAHLLAASKTQHPWNKHDNGEWFRLTEKDAVNILKEIA